jgi:hypothetical protein
MLKFSELLVENRGAETALSGHANEHFTNALIKEYVGHLSRSLRRGVDYDTAHKAALGHMNGIKYERHANIPEVQKGRQVMGDDEVRAIHDDSKKTAVGLLDHIKNNYGHVVEDSYHTGKIGPKGVKALTGGKSSEADVLLKTRSPDGQSDTARAILDHIGSSLKYSKDKTSTIKIHSPTVNKMAGIIDDHHQAMHGKSSGIHGILDKIGAEGVDAQRAALAPHHHALADYFNSLNDPKMTYSPVVDKNGNVTGGNLTQEAVSHIRDNPNNDPRLKAAYNDMSTENLKMKTRMAEALHGAMSRVLDHRSDDPNHAAIKESMLRSMGNLKTDKLPTFLVSTERSRATPTIYDVGHFYTQHLAANGTDDHNYTGKSTFSAGPLGFSLDTRPTTSKNPVTSFPINTTVKTSDIKKLKERETAPSTESPMQIASQRVAAKKPVAQAPAPTKDAFSGTDSPVAGWTGSANPRQESESGPSNSMFGKSFHAAHELE